MKIRDAVRFISENRERVVELERELEAIKYSKEWIDAGVVLRNYYAKGYISEPPLRSNDYLIVDELQVYLQDDKKTK